MKKKQNWQEDFYLCYLCICIKCVEYQLNLLSGHLCIHLSCLSSLSTWHIIIITRECIIISGFPSNLDISKNVFEYINYDTYMCNN